jgi:putative membrane protein
MLRITLASLHLLALGIGFGAVWERAVTLSEPLDLPTMQRAFRADSWWGIAAVLWIGTGLWRLLGATEKSTAYYMQNHVFFAKMGFLVLILALEIWPMVTLIRWRLIAGRRAVAWHPSPIAAKRIALISYIEMGLIVCMIVTAVMMARGIGTTTGG